MPRALKVCTATGCPNLVASGRCPDCLAKAEAKRGTAAQRGYGSAHWRVQRRACLRRDPLCVCHDTGHAHSTDCLAPSNVADHWPESRRDLMARGVPDPDALIYLRGICTSCHNKHTADAQPGGWAARSR